MKKHYLIRMALSTAMVIGLAACTGAPPPPTVDTMATTVVQLAVQMLTGTAGAATPTPRYTPTPLATPTATGTITPTSPPPKPPIVINFAPCWKGPGSNYTLISNISKGQYVQLLGRGSVPGWFVIANPYFHQACWIQAANLSIHVGTQVQLYPVMTPPAP